MLIDLRVGNTPEYSPVKITEGERYKHIFIAGMPGVGKTALLSNFWRQDCLLPTAKVLIDPSGFFAQEALSMAKKAIYCSIDSPVGINPMLDDYHPDDIADCLIEAINQVIELSTENVKLTVRMRFILREAIVWCVENNRRRLDSVVDYLSNRGAGHAETRQGLIDRINMFIQDKRMNEILCEAPAISWSDIIENKKTFILDCHGMSEDKMVFLGTLITHGIKSYLRYSKKDEYPPLALYVDECHLFINPNYFTILKEGRKYHVSAILATQDFANMPKQLTATILSNVGTLLSFRVGFMEASLLSREFPSLQTKDLQNLPKFHCAFRTFKSEGTCKTLAPPFIKKAKPTPVEVFKEFFQNKWFDHINS